MGPFAVVVILHQKHKKHLSSCFLPLGFCTLAIQNFTDFFAGLFALVAWSFIQIFFPIGDIGQTIYALLGAVVFSGFIVFDTANLIQNYDLDQVCLPSAANLPPSPNMAEMYTSKSTNLAAF